MGPGTGRGAQAEEAPAVNEALSRPGRPLRVAAFTAYPWEHALTTLRLVDPLHFAGVELLRGNDEADFYPERVEEADLVVIQRDFPRWYGVYTEVVRRARAGGKPLVYETDDLLLDLPEDHPDRPIHYYTPALLPMLQALLEADAVTVTTPALAEALQPLNPRIHLLPNYLDDRHWRLAPRAQPGAGEPLILGYMGSTTHAPDLEAVSPALAALLARCGERLRLHFWGGPPPAGLRAHPQVGWTDLQLRSYPEFVRYFSAQDCHLCLAPLEDSAFNRCKSAVKFFEYSALGLPGVYGRTAPYEGAVCHGENGFLASTPDEWLACLTRLVDDPELRLRMGRAAMESVRRDWLLSEHAGQWRRLYESLLDPAAPRLQTGPLQAGPGERILLSVASQVSAWLESREAELGAAQQRLAESEAARSQISAELDGVRRSRGWALLERLRALRRRL